MTTKLEKLKEKQAQIKAQIQREVQRESNRKRKEETRKKILLGAMVLDRMNKNEDYKNNIHQKLETYLTNDRDRELFGLELKKAE